MLGHEVVHGDAGWVSRVATASEVSLLVSRHIRLPAQEWRMVQSVLSASHEQTGAVLVGLDRRTVLNRLSRTTYSSWCGA